jgi:hypothetical protein
MSARVLPRGFELPGTRPRRKYGAKGCVVAGVWFRSQREGNRYAELLLLRRTGEVKLILLQVPFILSECVLDAEGHVAAPSERYIADFVIHWSNGRLSVEDSKGHRTADFIRKKRRCEALHNIVIEEV